MELVHAIVYGILQGIFAYIPVSSDAQIRLFQALVGWQGDESATFAAFTGVIQLGPTLAVIIFLRKEVGEAIRGLINALTGKEKGSHEAKMGMGVIIGTIPIIILGLAFQKKIENDWRSLNVIAISLIIGAIIMFFADRRQDEVRTEADIEVKDGIMVGLWQCLALIPGMSRSGCTISGALFQKFRRPDAARFAFLLGIPSFTAAGLFSLAKHHTDLKPLISPLMIALTVSFVVAYACLAWLLQFLQRNGFLPFIIYRVVLGIVILGLVFAHIINPSVPKETTPVSTSTATP